MSLPNIHPLVLDELLVLISGAFMESFSADEQAVIGTFLATLGSIISLNSVYILYMEGLNPENTDHNNENKQDNEDDDKYDLLEKSLEKIKEEIEKIKETRSYNDVRNRNEST